VPLGALEVLEEQSSINPLNQRFEEGRAVAKEPAMQGRQV